MASVSANGIDISYEVSGSGDPLLLVMGLGGQLTDWHPGLVERLARQFTVIRFDNRDIGLSTHSDMSVPTRWQLFKAALRPSSVEPPYALTDMADDAADLLRAALHIDEAHVLGISMGGMIAQLLAIREPSPVRSLCSVMSHTGDRKNGRPSPRVLLRMARRGEPGRDEILDLTLDFFELVGGADWDREAQRERTSASLERAYNPGGVLRQSQAIATAADRTESLGRIQAPTLVIHGLDDKLVRPSGGIATAMAIPSSRLLMFPRMGHDMPTTRHDEIVAAVVENAARASSPALSLLS